MRFLSQRLLVLLLLPHPHHVAQYMHAVCPRPAHSHHVHNIALMRMHTSSLKDAQSCTSCTCVKQHRYCQMEAVGAQCTSPLL